MGIPSCHLSPDLGPLVLAHVEDAAGPKIDTQGRGSAERGP